MDMEQKNNQDMDQNHACGGHGYSCGVHGFCGHKKRWWLRCVIWLIVLWLVFSAGYGLGKIKGYLRYGVFGYGTGMSAPYGMMGQNGISSWQGMRSMMFGNDNGDENKGWGMMRRWFGSAQNNAVYVFGAITKTDGNKITIIDNGGKEQIVILGSDTVIYSASDEMSLSALKAGQSIRAGGMLNKDGQLNTKEIRVY